MTSNTDTGDTGVLASTTTEIDTMEDVENTDDKMFSNPRPRESLITTAINFLQNTKVRHTTLVQKQKFLRSKGLTLEEIQLACERAGVFTQDPTTVINMAHSQVALQHRQSAFGRIKEIMNSIALIGGLAYAVYIFWKKYIVAFLFGNEKKKKPIEEALDDIDKKVETRISELSRDLGYIKDTLAQQQREYSLQFNREFSNFRSDLEAIKGLLLNRKQFASPLSAVGAPSIPAWQLSTATPHHLHHHRHSQSDDNEKADDAGSGSGSSETEVVTKNSDSSLEIM